MSPNSRFVALPVCGDSFYLRRGTIEILVDGGEGARTLPSEFLSWKKKDKIDVALCTHNDSDHAEGILAVVAQGLCNEVWLPANWLHRLHDVLNNPADFLVELVENVEQYWSEEGLHDNRERLVCILNGDEDEDFSFPAGNEEMVDFESIEPIIDGDLTIELAFCRGVPECRFGPCVIWTAEGFRTCVPISTEAPEEIYQLISSFADKFQNIRKIVLAAFQKGIPIRWFQFQSGANQVGGG